VSPENWLEVAVYAGEKKYPLKKHSNNQLKNKKMKEEQEQSL